MDDSQHLLIVDLVALFYQRQELAIKYNAVLLLVSR